MRPEQKTSSPLKRGLDCGLGTQAAEGAPPLRLLCFSRRISHRVLSLTVE